MSIESEVAEMVEKARTALVNGNINKAQMLYNAAATKLSGVANCTNDKFKKNEFHVQAAELYFEGGYYAKAYQVLMSVNGVFLNENEKWKAIWDNLRKHCEYRIEADYVKRMAHTIERHVASKRWNKVIRSLADNPYIFDAVKTATFREMACRGLAMNAIADEFKKDVERLSADHDNAYYN